MATGAAATNSSWSGYVGRFHAERPGITERILGRCSDDGLNPYQWAAQPFASHPGPTLDVACGSGPMADYVTEWTGVDTSAAELRLGRDRARGSAVLGSATRLPIAAAAFSAVVCSMSMQVIDPLRDAVAELARVMAPGGRAVLLLPASGPVPWRDALTYLHLQVALRARVRYLNDAALQPPEIRASFEAVGVTVTEDATRGFRFALTTPADADSLVESLYLPDVGAARIDAARRVVARRVGGEITIPLRRIVAIRKEIRL